jgi:hypothetical protein
MDIRWTPNIPGKSSERFPIYKGESSVGSSSYFWRRLNVLGSVILLNSLFFIEPTLQVGRNKNLQLVVL